MGVRGSTRPLSDMTLGEALLVEMVRDFFADFFLLVLFEGFDLGEGVAMERKMDISLVNQIVHNSGNSH